MYRNNLRHEKDPFSFSRSDLVETQRTTLMIKVVHPFGFNQPLDNLRIPHSSSSARAKVPTPCICAATDKIMILVETFVTNIPNDNFGKQR